MAIKPHCVLMASLLAASMANGQDSKNDGIEEVITYGRAQQFYLEKQTSIGSKIELEQLNLPQSAQILSAQLIEDQAARDITDLYRSIAGVSEFSYSGVTFRGFRDSSNVFYDGVRGDPYSGFSVPQLFNVERVEILKGPASALYGGGEPGGMINYVTKKPSFDDNVELSFTTGSRDLRGGSLEATGGLTESIAYRLGAFYEEADSFRNNADEVNIEIAGGLLFELSDATRLTTTFDYINQDLGGNRFRGVPVDDEGRFLVDPSYNSNEASDFQDLEAWVVQLSLEHRFNDQLRNTTTVRYLDNERFQKYHEPRGWIDANGDGVANAADQVIRREYRDQDRANTEYSVTTDFVLKVDNLAGEHQFLFGADFHDVDSEYEYLRARYEGDGVRNLNIFNLNYGLTDPSSYRLRDLNRDGAEARRWGLYVQDYWVFNKNWSLMAGLRYDNFDNTDKASSYSFDDSNVSPRIALIYKPAEGSTVYLNYSESFNPVSVGNQADVAGEATLEPETGEQIELGIKNEWLDGRIMTTAAIYQIKKQNVVQQNPNDTADLPNDGIPPLVNIGEVESEGVELSLVGDLAANWTITANYAYNDTQVVKGVSGDSLRNTFGDGSRFVNAPEHQLGLWTRYDFESIDSAIAFGVDYVSEQFSFHGQRVRPYTIFDMSWQTQWNDTLIKVNVHNLFDKEYAVSGFSERTGHFPGAPREVVLQVVHSL
ncbi:TonB-dependent siderophore receptor [Pseudoteredinibacter isoporae]|uniref:Iron complex outermembrane receptor protein n=1 Tax=Pseudoteredinibacter isoporae TaxID=570281 RepID=A0A7X0JUF1_9GAMM|nr:TonB-dependent receptor [Pseudoteredinibacter isoporae]MBB6521903.1 iron complex outermembrane receptor protein [Pseudoteredinibacter isoporae]